MILVAELTDPQRIVGSLGVAIFACVGVFHLVRWFLGGPSQPEPWGEEVTTELASDECTPLCHECLTPHQEGADFCPACGAPVGAYTNFLPFPYLFSVGHVLRIGTSGNFKRSSLNVVGFFLFAFVEYAIFAPVYWVMLLKNLFRQSHLDPPPTQPSGPPTASSKA